MYWSGIDRSKCLWALWAATAGLAASRLLLHQMKSAPELVMHRDDGAVDVADQAVAKHHAGDLPVAAAPRMRQRRKLDDARRLAAWLAAQRLVCDRGQFRAALGRRRHQGCSDGRTWRARGVTRAASGRRALR